MWPMDEEDFAYTKWLTDSGSQWTVEEFSMPFHPRRPIGKVLRELDGQALFYGATPGIDAFYESQLTNLGDISVAEAARYQEPSMWPTYDSIESRCFMCAAMPLYEPPVIQTEKWITFRTFDSLYPLSKEKPPYNPATDTVYTYLTALPERDPQCP